MAEPVQSGTNSKVWMKEDERVRSFPRILTRRMWLCAKAPNVFGAFLIEEFPYHFKFGRRG